MPPSLNQISFKKYAFIDFIVNSSVLFRNLLELFFLTSSSVSIASSRDPSGKQFFQKKNLLVLKWFLKPLQKDHSQKKNF